MKKTIIIGIVFLFLLSLTSLARFENGIIACDRGTENVREQVAVCDEDDRIIATLQSTALLSQTNTQPFQRGMTTLLYDPPAEGEHKMVRIILTLDITAVREKIYLGSFAANMIGRQSLMVKLDGEYYLFSYPEEEGLFDTSKLKLKHIPTGREYPSQLYAGTTWYLFPVMGGKSIAIGIFGNMVVISSLQPGETPAAYVAQEDLSKNYEVAFTKNTPVNITSIRDGEQLTICRQDNDADVQQAILCRNDEAFVTLKKGNLTLVQFPPDTNEYALLYDYVNNQKKVSIFEKESKLGSAKPDADLDYNNFINNMVQGRRLALEFQNHLYLLSHPVSNTLSLPALILTAYEPAGTRVLSAFGTPDIVEFTALGGGKIFLRLNYGIPPPPFNLWALTQEELKPVDLEKDLSTSMSSETAVNVVNPSLGRISISNVDNKLYQRTFKVNIGGTETILTYQTPKIINSSGKDTLFYYQSVQADGLATPVKIAAIYQYFDLDRTEKSRTFNTSFIETFTHGKELALGFSGGYYLLGHRGNPAQTVLYDPESLTLRRLNDSISYHVNYDPLARRAGFNVPQGQIEVQENDGKGLINFSAKTGRELSTEEFSGLWAELNTQNRVRIDNSVLRLCFLTSFADLTSAKVCDDSRRAISYIADPAKIITINHKEYLLESNLQMGEDKKVFIRKIISLGLFSSYYHPDWFAFVNEITAERKPVFNVSGSLYLPFASNSRLQSFGFGAYPGGRVQYPALVTPITPISSYSSTVLYDKIVFIMQEETTSEEVPLRVNFVNDLSYVPDDGGPLAFNGTSSTIFPPMVTITKDWISQEGGIYQLNITPINPNLLTLRLAEKRDPDPRGVIIRTIINRVFAVGDTKQLTLDGARVEIKVQEIKKDLLGGKRYVLVTMKRI